MKDCDATVLSIGLCNKHWRRNRAYGSPTAVKSQSGLMIGLSAVERFWRQVKKGDGCWLWSAATDKDGYGVFRGEVAGKLYAKAHRFSYALSAGKPVPERLVVMHSCDNPRCVRPEHLSVGTTRDNMLDKFAKGRGHLPRSSLAPIPVLAEQQVHAIVLDARPYAQIAADYGVSPAMISGVKRSVCWNTVDVGVAMPHGAEPILCSVKGCEAPAAALGLCAEHWRRNREYGSPAAIKMHLGQFAAMPAEDRFWAQVQKTEQCWLWIGGTDKDGYGSMRAKLGGRLFRRAHRNSYSLHSGEIVQDGMVVMHSCDTPKCVNPDHLSVGTPRDNMIDKITKGRAGSPSGANSVKAKLSEAEVRKICADPRTHAQIAADYGVAASTVGSLKQGVSWKSLGIHEIAHAKRVGKRGETQWAAKLTEEAVREIRSSSLTGKSLAEKFGVTQQLICDIRKRRAWKHVL